MWWNDQLKAALKRKEDVWKEVLGTRDEVAKERCWEVYKEEKKVKRCIYQNKEEVQEQLGREMNQDVNGNRKLFWKEVSKVNAGKVENPNIIKDENGRLVLKETEVRRIWVEYYEDLHNTDTKEQVAVHMYGFNGVQRGNYFGGELIRRKDVEV